MNKEVSNIVSNGQSIKAPITDSIISNKVKSELTQMRNKINKYDQAN